MHYEHQNISATPILIEILLAVKFYSFFSNLLKAGEITYLYTKRAIARFNQKVFDIQDNRYKIFKASLYYPSNSDRPKEDQTN
ncbi:MAG: hypothetical protein Kow0049_06130 [Stanieria sp.]